MKASVEQFPLAIAGKIALIRDQRVLLDSDLAALYEVPTKRFNEQVKRNLNRFPADFMFQLTGQEYEPLRSQTATLEKGRGKHRKYLPYAFTEHGAIMAAMILNSPHATNISVYVVRAFIQLRELATSNSEIALRLDELASRTDLVALKQESFEQEARVQIGELVEALRVLMAPPPAPKRRPIGFVTPQESE